MTDNDSSVTLTLQVFFNAVPHVVTVKSTDRVDAICAAVSPLVNVKSEALCMFSESWVGALQHDTPLLYFHIQEGTRLYCFGSNAVAAVAQSGSSQNIDGADNENANAADDIQDIAGIENIGNTCFFGSALQCLFRCETLRAVLLNMLPATALKHCDQFLRALVSAFQTLEQGKTTVNPSDLLQKFGALHPALVQTTMGVHIMQDAQEVLGQILADLALALPLDVLRTVNRRGSQLKGYLGFRSALLSSLNDSTDQNVIDCLFAIKVQYYLEDLAKEPCSSDFKYFMNVGITGKNVSLLDQLDHDMEGERVTIDGEQRLRIPRFSFLPPFLFVTVNRFLWEEQTQRRLKITKRFSFPFKLDLYKYCTADFQASLDSFEEERVGTDQGNVRGSAEYTLTSVIAHNGSSANSGHYITYSRISDDKWVRLNDELVTEVRSADIEMLAGGSPTFVAYVLLYESASLGEAPA